MRARWKPGASGALELHGIHGESELTPWAFMRIAIGVDAPWTYNLPRADTSAVERLLNELSAWFAADSDLLCANTPSGPWFLISPQSERWLSALCAVDPEFTVYQPRAGRAVACSTDDDRLLIFQFEIDDPATVVRIVPAESGAT